MNIEINPTVVSLPLGTTVAERLATARSIVKAMTAAIIAMYENDMAEKDNPDMDVFTTILLEAQYAEHYLSKL